MNRITKDPQVRMAEILDTAETLFYAKGYHETAISDIVKAIGVAQGTFYYYFKSKEEILEALISRRMQQVISAMGELTAKESLNPLQKLEMFVETLFRTICYKDGLLFEFLYNDRYLHLMDKMTRQGKAMAMPYLNRILEEGREKGYFAIKNSVVAQTFVGNIMLCLFDVAKNLRAKSITTTLRWRYPCL